MEGEMNVPDWLHIVGKSLGAVVILFILTRILGKKQISQLTFFEYITGITLGGIAGFISTDVEANYIYGVIALLVWTLLPLSMEYLGVKSKFARDWLEGRGAVFIKDGKVLEDNMKKERYSSDELLSQLRKRNVFQVADVEFAVLEANGELSVLLKKENQPLTPKHLGIKVPRTQEPQTVIMDGEVMLESLATRGLNLEWLHTELQKMGIPIENVYLGQVDDLGQLYVDLYDDQLKVPEPQSKAVLHATLKKCAADLELFALTTQNGTAKSMYGNCATQMNELIEQMTPLLKR